ncbi:MFS transporter [Stenotrophomonas panacihumi]|uniref:MFS transporter n=1 Tax=Stenotrophomonas panacihumi TaxID=676599 RepID=A0A0R0API3_9GAMM|nr:MFS transporter [Stenotrophomonas panacihumi]KRG46617.1 MFS transporter [Stenotrophomonas panacihumi]PTN54239.1 MFS transporter [Stenotrophomonas panacihumi]
MNVETFEHPPAHAAPPSILSPRYRATTLAMVALVALNAFEVLAVATAMPTVARELSGLSLYALAFGGTLATSLVGMTVAGRWSDRAGPAPVLWGGMACFVAGLLMSGVAGDMAVLVGGRLLQGLGAGAFFVALYVIVGRLYPEPLRPKVFAAFSAGWVVPSLVGPAISGLIVQHLGWRWVFLGVPLLAVPAAWLLRPGLRELATLPRSVAATPAGPSPVGWAIGAAAGALLLHVAEQLPWPSRIGAWLLGGGALLLCAHRLLPAGTLALRRGLPSVIALRGIAAAAFFSCEAFLPLLLSREHGYSPLAAGVALSVGALGWSAGSWYQGHRLQAHRRLRAMGIGASWLLAGIATVAGGVGGWPAWLAIAGWLLAGVGMGLLYPSLSVLMLSLSPAHLQGRNSSALQLSEAMAVTAALAATGAVFAGLLEATPTRAYLAAFGLSAALAGAAWATVRRV